MKLTVLIDNNTLIDRYFHGEPGVSYLIQERGINILFDTGYTDTFIKNAQKMNINLRNIDFVAISHGHIDHTWGLVPLIRLYGESKIENINYVKPTIIAHPHALFNKKISDGEEIGTIINEEKLRRHFNMNLTKEPFWITDKIVFLGEIERKNSFENKTPIGKYEYNKTEIDDYVIDDSALVYKSSTGLVIITGCSHAGICNIIEYAKKICNEERILDIIGGFHLLDPTEELLKYTCAYIRENNIREIHACHCTDLRSKIELSKVANLKEVGVGLGLEYD